MTCWESLLGLKAICVVTHARLSSTPVRSCQLYMSCLQPCDFVAQVELQATIETTLGHWQSYSQER